MSERSKELYARFLNSGADGIRQLIADTESEDLYLDFKRSSDHGCGKSLDNKDRANYAKAVSGFGNSEGGVICWGVDCRHNSKGADVTVDLFPIENVQKFKSWLDGATSGVTVPAHSGVLNDIILDESGVNGFVISLIPKSNQAPHQTTKDSRYYMRAGSNFLPVPHSVLSGMFGRRPQPKVYHRWDIPLIERQGKTRFKFSPQLVIHNDGPGIAELMFANLRLNSMVGDPTRIEFITPDSELWWHQFVYGRHLSIIARDGFRLPPNCGIRATGFDISLHPPFETPFTLEGECGAADTESWPFNISVSPKELQELYEQAIKVLDTGGDGWDVAEAIGPIFLHDQDKE